MVYVLYVHYNEQIKFGQILPRHNQRTDQDLSLQHRN